MMDIYLNLGCGSIKFDGFCNIDLLDSADLSLDIDDGLPFSDNSVSGIYSEHFIEHLTQAQILRLLRECRRVLRAGGRLRIATPDLDALVSEVHNDQWRQPWLDKYGYQWVANRAEYLNISMREWGRQYLLNEEELVRLARLVGLDDVHRCAIGVSDDSMLAGRETRAESTLVLEFVKRDTALSETPRVSIVIPAFRAEFFSECLRSAFEQDYPAFEVLVGDDGANDEIARQCSQARESGRPVYYVRNDSTLGEVDNFTALIRRASGELIKPLHDDDVLERDAVSRLVRALLAAPGASLAIGRRYPIDATGRPLDRNAFGAPLGESDAVWQGPDVVGMMLAHAVNCVGEPTSMLFRREDALSWLEPNVMALFGRTCWGAGDVALATRLLSRGDLAYTAAMVAAVRWHPSQTQAQPGHMERGRATWAYLRQHGVRLGFLTPELSPFHQPRRGRAELPKPSSDHSQLRISVGLISYNQEEWVEAAIESLFAQTWPIDRLVICDDASTDETWVRIEAAVARCQANRPHAVRELVLQRNETNHGYLSNFQQAVRLAGGDLFVYQAGDDVSLHNRIERLVQTYELAGRPRHALLHSSVYVDSIDPQRIWHPPVQRLATRRDRVTAMALHIGASEAFTPGLLWDIGTIEGSTYDDLILGARAAMLNTLIYVDEPLLMYRSGGLTSGRRGLSSPDADRLHVERTLLQRLSDAQALGATEETTWLRDRIESLGMTVPPASGSSVRLSRPIEMRTDHAGVTVETVPLPALLRVCVLSAVPYTSAAHAGRIARLEMLERAGASVELVWWRSGSALPDLAGFDLVWVYGVPVGPDVELACDALDSFRSTVVWEIDVWPQEGAGSDPAAATRVALARRLMQRCSIAVVSHPDLAQRLRQDGVPSVVLMRDAIASTWWPSISSGVLPPASTTLTLGIRAEEYTAADWSFVEELLWTVVHRLPGCKVRIWGRAPDTVRAIDRVLVISEQVYDAGWSQRLAADPVDIALVPWLRGKGHEAGGDRLWLEWVAAGACVIVSDIGRFDDAVTQQLVLSVPNQVQAWTQAIEALAKSPGQRLELRARALTYVQQARCMRVRWVADLTALNEHLPPVLRLPLPEDVDIPEALPPSDVTRIIDTDDYRRWCRDRDLREVDAETLAERVVAWGKGPEVLFITVASTAQDIAALAVTAASLGAQLYAGWRWLVLSDQASPDPLFESTPQLGWWQLSTLDDPLVVVQAVKQALETFSSTWMCWLLPGAYVHADASIEVLDIGVSQPDVDAVFHDHDHWDETAELGNSVVDAEWLARRRLEPSFKPGLDLYWLLQADYVGPCVWLRASWVCDYGLSPLPGAWWYDALLRVAVERPHSVVHLPKLLLSLPQRLAGELQTLALPARRACVEALLPKWAGEVAVAVGSGLSQRTLQLLPQVERIGISVVVVLQDVHFQSREVIESLLRQDVGCDEVEWIVVAHRVTDPDTKELLRDPSEGRWPCIVLEDTDEFDLGRLYDRGVAQASHDMLVFVHADAQPLDAAMLSRLSRVLVLPGVGVAAPLLMRPESATVDCAGVVPGGPQQWQTAHSVGAPFGLMDEGPWGSLRVLRSVPAVDSVLFAMHRNTWSSLGGLAVTGACEGSACAVDWALRVQERGLSTVVVPTARAVHQRGLCSERLYPSLHERLQMQGKQLLQGQSVWLRHGRRWADHPRWPNALSLRHDGWHLDDVSPIRWPIEGARRPRTLGYSVSGGSGEYRVKSPLRALAESGLHYTEVVERQPSLLTAAELLRLQPDQILLHQWLGPATLEAIHDWRRVNPSLRVVLGLDDRNDAVPEKSNLFGAHRRAHPDARAKLRRVASAVDAVVVSTEPLRELLDELGLHDTPVHVVPNTLSRARWAGLTPPRRPRSRPRVGWIGALQHRGDLEWLMPVIRATRDVVDWVFMGMTLAEVQSDIREFHRWVPYERYPAAIAGLDLDLAIAPLAMNIFNECKSNLRLLEYGAAAYPVICTDITPYRYQDPPVLRLPNEVDAWVEAIRSLVTDIDALRRAGQSLRDWVWQHYDLADHLPQWDSALTGSGG